MDTNSNKPTKRTGSVSTSPKSSSGRLSAEEKLKKSIKNLSYTSGGASGANLDTTKSSARSSSFKATESTRKKVGGVVLDVETIQDATKQKLETRGKRNGIVIMVLSVLLVVSLVYLAVVIVNYKNGQKDPNCKYTVVGDAEASWIVEGKSDTEFRLRQGLSTDMIYLLDSSLKVETSQSVTISIEIKVLLNDEPIMIAGLYEMNEQLVRVENTNKFVYQNTLTGGGTVLLFKGIDFSEAPSDLTSNNIQIEVIANVNTIG